MLRFPLKYAMCSLGACATKLILGRDRKVFSVYHGECLKVTVDLSPLSRRIMCLRKSKVLKAKIRGRPASEGDSEEKAREKKLER